MQSRVAPRPAMDAGGIRGPLPAVRDQQVDPADMQTVQYEFVALYGRVRQPPVTPHLGTSAFIRRCSERARIDEVIRAYGENVSREYLRSGPGRIGSRWGSVAARRGSTRRRPACRRRAQGGIASTARPRHLRRRRLRASFAPRARERSALEAFGLRQAALRQAQQAELEPHLQAGRKGPTGATVALAARPGGMPGVQVAFR